MLADRYAVSAVCTDAGGVLNAYLLAAGLVDEISVIVAPRLAGSREATWCTWPTRVIVGTAGSGCVDVQVVLDAQAAPDPAAGFAHHRQGDGRSWDLARSRGRSALVAGARPEQDDGAAAAARGPADEDRGTTS